MNKKKIHIGEEIKRVSKSKYSRDIDFAKVLNKSRQTVYDLYKRETIDVNTLLTISKALSYDFFKIYQEQLPFHKEKPEIKTNNEPTEAVEAVLQIKLNNEKKAQVLNIVLGKNILDILEE